MYIICLYTHHLNILYIFIYRGGQNPPDLSNLNRTAPIRANFVSFFAGSGWELRNPVGSVWVAGLGKIFMRVTDPPRFYPHIHLPQTKNPRTLTFLTSENSILTPQSSHSRTHSLSHSRRPSPTRDSQSLTHPVPESRVSSLPIPHPSFSPFSSTRTAVVVDLSLSVTIDRAAEALISLSSSRSLTHLFPHFRAPAPHAQTHHRPISHSQ